MIPCRKWKIYTKKLIFDKFISYQILLENLFPGHLQNALNALNTFFFNIFNVTLKSHKLESETLSTIYNSAKLLFFLMRGLSRLIKSLCFISRQNSLHSWANTVKSSRQVKECDYIITILISLTAKTTMKFVHNTRCKIIRYLILQVKNTWQDILRHKNYL